MAISGFKVESLVPIVSKEAHLASVALDNSITALQEQLWSLDDLVQTSEVKLAAKAISNSLRALTDTSKDHLLRGAVSPNEAM